jgi:hypothetical protein
MLRPCPLYGEGTDLIMRSIRLCGLLALAVIVFASFLPAKWEQLRTGHWAVEHFLAYFVATSIICLGWHRPFIVAGSLVVAAAILEALQSLTPNHTPNFLSVVSGAGGALAAVLLAELIRGIWRAANRQPTEPQVPPLSQPK